MTSLIILFLIVGIIVIAHIPEKKKQGAIIYKPVDMHLHTDQDKIDIAKKLGILKIKIEGESI